MLYRVLLHFIRLHGLCSEGERRAETARDGDYNGIGAFIGEYSPNCTFINGKKIPNI